MKNSILLILIIIFLQFVSSIYSQNDEKPELVLQLGHSGKVKSAVFSPDGKLIASNGAGGIIVWQTSTGREIRRIPGVFSSIDFAPDSKTVVAAETTEEFLEVERKIPFSIEIYDVSNGALVKKFPTHKNKINSVKFSGDGHSILTASDDNTAKLWNVADGSLRSSYLGSKSEVTCAIFSPDNKFIATAGAGAYSSDEKRFTGDSTARIYDATTGDEIKSLIHRDEQAYFEGIGFLQFSPNGQFLVTSAKPPYVFSDAAFTIKIWNWKTGALVAGFVGKGTIGFSPDGDYLLADIAEKADEGGYIDPDYLDGIELLDWQSGRVVARFYDYASMSRVGSLSFSPDGKAALVATETIYSGGTGIGDFGENSLKLFDLAGGFEIYDLGQDVRQVKQLDLSGDETHVLAGDYLWNLEKGLQVELEKFNFEYLEKEFNGKLPTRVFSNDGKILVESISGDDENERTGFQLWDVETGKEVKTILTDSSSANVYIPTGNQFLLTESGGSVCSWKISDAKMVWCIDTSDAYSRAAGDTGFFEVSQNEKTVFIRNRINSLMAVDLLTGQTIWQSPLEMNPFPGIFMSDGKYVIVPTGKFDDKYLSFLDASTGNQVFKVEAGNYSNTNIENILIAYQKSKNRYVFIDKNTGQIVTELPKEFNDRDFSNNEDFRGRINSYSMNFALSKDFEKFLAVEKNEIRLFELKSGKELRTFRSHNGEISGVMFFHNEDYILSSSFDGTTRIWDVKTGNVLCSLISFDNGTWFVTAPEGRFDTNKLESSAKIHWIVPDDPLNPLPVEIFMRQYYEPNLLKRVLKCIEENTCDSEFKPLPSIAEINRVQPKIEIKEVKPTGAGLADVLVEVESVTEEVSVSATDRTKKESKTSGVYDLRLFRDGQLVGNSTDEAKLETFIKNAPALVKQTQESGRVLNTPEDEAWREANMIELKDGKAVYTFKNVSLPADGTGKVEFSAYAFNSDRVKSNTSRTEFEYKSKEIKKGNTYLVSIGVNQYENKRYDLNYAANDSYRIQSVLGEKLSAELKNKGSNLFQIPLVSDYATGETAAVNNATKDTIKGAFRLLAGRSSEVSDGTLANIPVTENGKSISSKDLPKVEPEDTLIISVSSHGYAAQSGIFYILPSDIGAETDSITDDVLTKLISSDELSLWMRDITAQEMLLIVDACHSAASVQGAGFKPGPMGSRGLGQLAYDKGMRIVAATQADDVALEVGSLKQGLLSYALITDGIEKKLANTDEPEKNELFIKEWLRYSEKRVPELYDGIKDGTIKNVGAQCIGAACPKVVIRQQRPGIFDFRRNKSDSLLLSLD